MSYSEQFDTKDIVIVDGSLENLRLLADILNSGRYRIHPCANTKIAWAAIMSKAPHIILLDINIAAKDDYEICRRLKSDPRTAGVPMLIVNHHDDADGTAKALASGCDDCIGKPLHKAEVSARVRTHLRLQALSRNLDRKVDLRTAELTAANRRLTQSFEFHLQEDTLIQFRLGLIQYAAEHSLHELMQRSLDEVEVLTQSKIGFYHFVLSDQKTLSLAAWSTNTVNKFCKAVDFDTHYGIEEAGVWVDCLREKKAMIHNDYESLPHKKGMPDGHAEVVRQLVVPIFRKGKIVSILGVGNKETDYTEEDVQIATYCADVVWEITATKQAQEALKLSEQKYSKVFSNAPIWVVLSALSSGRYIEVNENFLQTTGFRREEVIGRTSSEIGTWVNPEDRREILNLIKSQGQIRDFEVQRRSKTGEVLTMLFSAEIIEVSGERCLLSVSQDISSRKQVEKALRQSEERFRRLFQQAPIPFMILDIKGNVQYINDRFTDYYGYTCDDISTIDALWTTAYPDPSERDRVSAAWHSIYRTVQKGDKAVDPLVGDLTCKNGSVRTAEMSAISLGDVLLTSWVDLTEKKRVQDEINQRKQFLELVLSHLPDAVVTLDSDHRIVDWNPGAVKMFGYTPEETIGLNLDDLVARGDEYIEASTNTKHVLSGERLDAFETIRYRIDGTPLNVIAAGSPIMIDNTLTGVVAVYTDISEQKKIQDERKEYEARIQQMQKMEAIGTLAGGIAHDFNNILSGVIGYAELSLTATPKDKPLFRNLQQILAGGRRAGDLVRQILTFSRQNKRELKPLQIGPLFKEALKLLRSSLPTTVEIVQHIAPRVENVMADPTQVHQIIMNLCTNAAQSMEENGGRMTVELSQVALLERDVGMQPGVAPGIFAQISIQDTGYGILPENIEKIFNPYFTTKGTGEGTGLGLSVVHGIVQSYGGFIDVISSPGQGTTFDVYIPAIEIEDLNEEAEDTVLPTGTERILVVDDEAVLVDVMQGILSHIGYRVTTANSSLEALDKFAATPTDFDLVLTDMTMPDMTGIQLSSRIRNVRSDIPIVLCTGYSHQLYNNRAEDLGLQAIVMKPIQTEELAHTVRRVLDTA